MSRLVWLAIGALTALLVVLLALGAAAPRRSDSLVFTYSSTDAAPGGTLALRRWVAALGYQTESVQGERFVVPSETEVLFVLGPGPAPADAVTTEEAQRLREWVSRGGTLVIGSDRGLVDEALFTAFGVTLESRAPGPIAGEISPALARPVLRDLSTNTARALTFREPWVVLVGDADRAIAAERRIGSGVVWATSAPDMLANRNLGAAQNDRVVLNALADVRRGAVVAFDEYHHGARIEPDVPSLFTGTAPGRAALFAGAVVLLYVALRGRRFGRPIPLEERPARSSLEYVRSFAGLLRRSGATALAAERLARRYRRRLARLVGLRPSADADEVVAALATVAPADAPRVAELFRRLAAPVDENDLLAVVERAESEMERIGS